MEFFKALVLVHYYPWCTFNYLPLSLQKSHVSMYADDTAYSLSSKSIDDLQNILNLDLLMLQDWLHANKLSLNVVKTQSLITGSGHNIRKIEDRLMLNHLFL